MPGTDVTLADQMAYAQAITHQPERSGNSLLPAAYRGNPANVLIAMGLGQALGITPAQALYDIYVVNGRPSPSANLMAALVRRAGHKLRINGDATSCTATLIRADDPDEPFTATWTIEQAKAAGLAGKDTWKAYPAAMLRARAIAEVVRMGASEAVLGMDYSSEEMADVEATAPAQQAAPITASAFTAAATRDPGPTDGASYVTPPTAPAADDNIEDAVEVPDEPADDGPKITAKEQRHLFMLFNAKGIPESEQASGMAHILGRPVTSRTAMTHDEWARVIDQLEQLPDGGAPASDEAQA